jgi:hypothetical protein
MTACLNVPTAEELEIDVFDRLKPRLGALWDTVFPGDEEAYTSVIVPSLTLDEEELAKIPAIHWYEERLLFLLMRLRNPQARVVYVTSQPIHPIVLDYYLQLLPGIPASHARARLTLLCVYDGSPRSLTEKILERPRVMERIRASIPDRQRAYLTVYNSTPLERQLAVRLDIPMNAPDPRLVGYGTKSGSRKLFTEEHIDCPYGREDLHSLDDIVRALAAIHDHRPNVGRALLKLNDGFSGEGIARFTYPAVVNTTSIQKALDHLQFSVASESVETFLAKFAAGGGVAEEMIEARDVRSPSVQLRINPRQEVILASTHEQLLGGPCNQVFLGCVFPADGEYRIELQRQALIIGRALAAHGVIGRLSIDFLASRNEALERWRLTAIEINLRMGGTTHPALALRFLTGGEVDPVSGLLHGLDGRPKYYHSSDNVQSEAYRGLTPEDLIEIVTRNRLDFNHRTSTGVVFHMIGAVSEFGKFGMTAISNSRTDAERLFLRTMEVLDRETGGGQHD